MRNPFRKMTVTERAKHDLAIAKRNLYDHERSAELTKHSIAFQKARIASLEKVMEKEATGRPWSVDTQPQASAGVIDRPIVLALNPDPQPTEMDSARPVRAFIGKHS